MRTIHVNGPRMIYIQLTKEELDIHNNPEDHHQSIVFAFHRCINSIIADSPIERPFSYCFHLNVPPKVGNFPLDVKMEYYDRVWPRDIEPDPGLPEYDDTADWGQAWLLSPLCPNEESNAGRPPDRRRPD